MIRTPVCDLIGIDYPIFQGGMAWIADASLAGAVSAAGGLGIIAAMNANAQWVREQIAQVRATTDKPFGVNVMLMSPYADEVAAMVAEERVPVVVTGAGNPTKYMKMWLEAGIKVVPVVASCSMAKLMARMGACALVAEGGESGGHVGDLTTMALIPQVVDTVDIPVLAAGGIADGRQMAAAFMLGAQGVQVGTRFLVADECTVSEAYKQKVLKAKDISTLVTGRRTGHPVRALKTPFTIAFSQLEYSATTDDEVHGTAAGALKRAAVDGDEETGYFMAGQVAGMVTRQEPARDIICDLMTTCGKTLRAASSWLTD